MATARSLIAGLTLALTAISCTQDKSPTAPDVSNDHISAAKGPVASGPISQTVTGTIVDASGAVVGTFSGTATLTQMGRSGSNLTGSGTLLGTAVVNGVSYPIEQTFSNVALALDPAGSCPILHLDLGPIHLDILGLNVDLSRVVLDITAQAGPGNLLGNLLCAIVHLLDQSPINLTLLDQILQQINTILASL
jgi:hypothetical protein